MSLDGQQIFQAPYNTWNANQILDYYRTRSNVDYFPRRIDSEQVTDARINNVLINRFDMIGETYQLPESFVWTANPSRNQDIEWLVAFHKFYYAVALGIFYQKTSDRRYLDKWNELTSSWIDTVPLGFLDSHVTGRRIENWISAHYYFVTTATAHEISPQFYLKFLESLFCQVCHLRANLTPWGNHRTIELMAIFIAAVVFPEFRSADAWLDFARQELFKNLKSDLLTDGVHSELSTEYHHIVLRNFLRIKKLALLNNIVMPREMDELLQKAIDFSLYVHKPDGRIPALNDADMDSYLPLLKQGYKYYGNEEYLYGATQGVRGQVPGCRSRTFPASGYTILRSGWGDGATAYTDERYLVFDCGPFSRNYFSYHGHFDLLNIEMAAYGRSIIVDPGRFTYNETDPKSEKTNWRAHFRGTSAHNTVQVDGQNQLRYAFDKTHFKILGPEPDHELRAFVSGDGFDFVHGVSRSHEYETVHERKIFFPFLEYWIVSDILLAEENHLYELRYHLSDLAWQQTHHKREGGTDLVFAPHLVMGQPAHPQVATFVEADYISPAYGVKHPAPVIRYTCKADNMTLHTVLYPYQEVTPQITVQEVAVYCAGRKCMPTEAFALLVQIRAQDNESTDIYFCADNDDGHVYSFADFTYSGSFLLGRQTGGGNLATHLQPGGHKERIRFVEDFVVLQDRPEATLTYGDLPISTQ